MKTIPCAGLLLILAAGLLSPGRSAAEEPAILPAALSPGDGLLVRIDNLGGGLPEYREIVDTDGQIELPYLGFIPAAGKSLDEVQLSMAQAYANAGLATNVVVHLTFITHFEPPPPRSKLVRIQDPRQPVSAAPAPAAP